MSELAAERGGELPAYQVIFDYLWDIKRQYPTFIATLGHCAACDARYEPYSEAIDQNLILINQILNHRAPTISWHKPDGASMLGHAVEAYAERDKTRIIEIGFYAIDTQIKRTRNIQVPGVQVPLELIENLTDSPLPDIQMPMPLYLKNATHAQQAVQAPVDLANGLHNNSGREFAGGATIHPRPDQFGLAAEPAWPLPGD